MKEKTLTSFDQISLGMVAFLVSLPILSLGFWWWVVAVLGLTWLFSWIGKQGK
jgi:hypothetical protein